VQVSQGDRSSTKDLSEPERKINLVTALSNFYILKNNLSSKPKKIDHKIYFLV
jgi:hypothetical protein